MYSIHNYLHFSKILLYFVYQIGLKKCEFCNIDKLNTDNLIFYDHY